MAMRLKTFSIYQRINFSAILSLKISTEIIGIICDSQKSIHEICALPTKYAIRSEANVSLRDHLSLR